MFVPDLPEDALRQDHAAPPARHRPGPRPRRHHDPGRRERRRNDPRELRARRGIGARSTAAPPRGSAPGIQSLDPYDLIVAIADADSLEVRTEDERSAHRVHKVPFEVALEAPARTGIVGTIQLRRIAGIAARPWHADVRRRTARVLQLGGRTARPRRRPRETRPRQPLLPPRRPPGRSHDGRARTRACPARASAGPSWTERRPGPGSSARAASASAVNQKADRRRRSARSFVGATGSGPNEPPCARRGRRGATSALAGEVRRRIRRPLRGPRSVGGLSKSCRHLLRGEHVGDGLARRWRPRRRAVRHSDLGRSPVRPTAPHVGT